MKIIEDIKLGKRIQYIYEEFGVGKSQVYQEYKDRDKVAKNVLDGAVPKTSKIVVNKAKYHDIDSKVFNWFCSLRALRGTQKPLPVSGLLIKARAMYEAKKNGVQDFKASYTTESTFPYRWKPARIKCHSAIPLCLLS